MPMSPALQLIVSQQAAEDVLLAFNALYNEMVAGGGNTFGTVPFDANNFFATGAMTWTVGAGDQVTFRFCLQGTLLTMWLKLNTTTVGGTVAGNNLQVKLPNGIKAANDSSEVVLAAPGGGALEDILATFNTGSNIMTLARNAANWVVGADNTSVNVTISIEVQP